MGSAYIEDVSLLRRAVLQCVVLAAVVSACGSATSGRGTGGSAGESGSTARGGGESGGASNGGSSGGAVSGGSGGAATGGSTTGGTAQGGEGVGGSAGDRASSGGSAGSSAGGSSGSSNGGRSAGGATSGGSAGAGGTGARGGGGGAAGAGGAGSSCPATAPTVGEACTQDLADCGWGDSPFPECRQHRVCALGKWAQGLTPGMCRDTPAGTCPATVPERSSACAASDAGARCSFDDGSLCTCQTMACGGTGCTPLPFPQWICYKPPDGCPLLAPNAGDACDGNKSCMYEYCGLTAMCRNGRWLWQFGCA